MNFEDIVLTEVGQAQKDKYLGFHYMRCLRSSDIDKDRK